MIVVETIAESLLQDRSKRNVNALVVQMAKENIDVAAFLNYVRIAEMPVKWYLTWTLSHYLEAYPKLNTENQVLLWRLLEETRNESMLRDLWRTFSFLNIDDEIAGAVYDKALMITPSPSYAIAIRANAMTCAANICKAYPELSPELITALYDVLENDESPAMNARAKNTLKVLKKL